MIITNKINKTICKYKGSIHEILQTLRSDMLK